MKCIFNYIVKTSEVNDSYRQQIKGSINYNNRIKYKSL